MLIGFTDIRVLSRLLETLKAFLVKKHSHNLYEHFAARLEEKEKKDSTISKEDNSAQKMS